MYRLGRRTHFCEKKDKKAWLASRIIEVEQRVDVMRKTFVL